MPATHGTWIAKQNPSGGWGIYAENGDGPFALIRDEIDARLVVNAVNSHDDLLAALESSIETIRIWHDLQPDLRRVSQREKDEMWDLYQHSPEMQTINSAIAKAITGK